MFDIRGLKGLVLLRGVMWNKRSKGPGDWGEDANMGDLADVLIKKRKKFSGGGGGVIVVVARVAGTGALSSQNDFRNTSYTLSGRKAFRRILRGKKP